MWAQMALAESLLFVKKNFSKKKCIFPNIGNDFKFILGYVLKRKHHSLIIQYLNPALDTLLNKTTLRRFSLRNGNLYDQKT